MNQTAYLGYNSGSPAEPGCHLSFLEGNVLYTTNIQATAAANRKAKLWEAYREAPTAENRDALTKEYVYLSVNIASRLSAYLGTAAAGHDLVEEGLPGLIDAIYKYDGTGRFEDFAGARIRKSMIDAVTKNADAKRLIIDTKKKIDAARKDLLAAGKPAEKKDVANALDMTLPQLIEAETAFTLSSASSFSYLEEGGSQPFPIDRQELAARLGASMQQLSNSEKKVVLMFYYENLSRKEICKILGLEDSEVLRILSGAMEKMQAEMAEYMDIFVKSV